MRIFVSKLLRAKLALISGLTEEIGIESDIHSSADLQRSVYRAARSTATWYWATTNCMGSILMIVLPEIPRLCKWGRKRPIYLHSSSDSDSPDGAVASRSGSAAARSRDSCHSAIASSSRQPPAVQQSSVRRLGVVHGDLVKASSKFNACYDYSTRLRSAPPVVYFGPRGPQCD